jgi:rhomboid protease GluP
MMNLQLHKTLLSTKPDPQSILIGLFSYLLLVVLFFMDDQNLTANGEQVFVHGQYWKAFTSQLMHGDFSHLGGNTIFFTAFAILLNHYFGFWVFPVLSLLVGGVINLIALKIYDPQVTLVGISGVIYFMAAFWMSMFVLVERQMSLYRRLMIATGVSLILFFPEVFQKNVSYLAHGLGFGMGLLLGVGTFMVRKQAIRSHEVWVEKPPVDTALEEYIDALEAFEAEKITGDPKVACEECSTLH